MNEYFLNVVQTHDNINMPEREMHTIKTPFKLEPCTVEEIIEIIKNNVDLGQI